MSHQSQLTNWDINCASYDIKQESRVKRSIKAEHACRSVRFIYARFHYFLFGTLIRKTL